jgi:hypothetical protein
MNLKSQILFIYRAGWSILDVKFRQDTLTFVDLFLLIFRQNVKPFKIYTHKAEVPGSNLDYSVRSNNFNISAG